ncbi:putative ankyrin repeat-containing domain-containing protein [Helianthus anomalus]
MATHTTLPVQQGQVSTYNHPCADLFDEEKSTLISYVVPLYRASIEGDLEAAKVILDQDRRNLVAYSITEKKETPLHVAVAGHSTAFVSYLVNMMDTAELELRNEDGNTAFCIAAISGNVRMAKTMFEKNQALPTIGGMRADVWTDDVMDGVLLKCIEAGMFDVALRILEDNKQLPQDKHAWDVLHLLAGMPEAFHVKTQMISFLAFTSLVPKKKETNAMLLLRLLWKRIMENPKDVVDKILRGPMIEKNNMETYPSQILFIAAKMNNTQFLVELIHEYPGLMCKRNDDGQTIFHVAVAHRHYDVYSTVYYMRSGQ